EAEWEYACRARSVTSRYYGNSVELLPRYAQYIHNARDRAWPVGQMKPNDFGLFDMLGNAWQWCQGPGDHYWPGLRGRAVEDVEDREDVLVSVARAWRGGSYYDQPWYVRSASRYHDLPGLSISNVCLRIARTVR